MLSTFYHNFFFFKKRPQYRTSQEHLEKKQSLADQLLSSDTCTYERECRICMDICLFLPQLERERGKALEYSLLRESVPRQVNKESRGPQGERGLEFSKRKKGQTFFLSPHSLGLYNNNVSCLRTVSGLNLLLS